MIIKNVKIINPNETIANANVFIKDNKINKIEKLEGEGNKILIPGFIDIHTHGSGGMDVMDGVEEAQKIANFFASVGTTTFLPTLMTAPWEEILKKFQDLANHKFTGANVAGFHLEGPFISMEKKGAHNPKLLLKGSLKHMQDLISASNNKLRKIVLAPESTSSEIVKYLVKQNVIVSIGHSDAHGKEVDEYVNAGVSTCTHIWNGMSGVENRNPGIAQKALSSNKITAELICDFVHVDKETVKLTIDKKTPEFITLITDSVRPAGLDDCESVSGGLAIIKQGYKITLKDTGNIAGGATIMHDQFKNVISLGYSANDAVKMTSFNQAKELNLEKGEIAAGKDADLLIMDNNFKIEQIFILGQEITK